VGADLMVKEQYLESFPMQLAIFLRERKPKALKELAELAEQYLDAHANSKSILGKPVLKIKTLMMEGVKQTRIRVTGI